MHLAPAHTYVDSYSAWFETHGVAKCLRFNATITVAACETNQSMTGRKGSDSRCAGCGGLDNQPEPGRSFLPPVSVEEPEVDESPEAIEEPEIHPGADDFEDVELDLDDDELSAQFPELFEGDGDTEYPAFTTYQAPMPRYAVYKGRCKKCGGYVDNIREWHDDNVFRCLLCGWRTGVEYEENRKLFASGKGS